MPDIPSFASAARTPDRLLGGEYPRITEDITVLSGQTVLQGHVLGIQTVSTVPSTGTAGGGNTGNGTCGSVARGGFDLQPGTYTIKIVKAATNAGDFVLIAPDGSLVGYGTVAVAFTSTHLNFTVADGATDFVVGDTFTIAVTGTGKYKIALAAATDGSHQPVAIAAEDIDASAADLVGVIYRTGEFNQNDLTYGTGHTATTVAAAFEADRRQIWLRDSLVV